MLQIGEIETAISTYDQKLWDPQQSGHAQDKREKTVTLDVSDLVKVSVYDHMGWEADPLDEAENPGFWCHTKVFRQDGYKIKRCMRLVGEAHFTTGMQRYSDYRTSNGNAARYESWKEDLTSYVDLDLDLKLEFVQQRKEDKWKDHWVCTLTISLQDLVESYKYKFTQNGRYKNTLDYIKAQSNAFYRCLEPKVARVTYNVIVRKIEMKLYANGDFGEKLIEWLNESFPGFSDSSRMWESPKINLGEVCAEDPYVMYRPPMLPPSPPPTTPQPKQPPSAPPPPNFPPPPTASAVWSMEGDMVIGKYACCLLQGASLCNCTGGLAIHIEGKGDIKQDWLDTASASDIAKSPIYGYINATFEHGGGWSPLCGLWADTFFTPYFKGALEWYRPRGDVAPAFRVTSDVRFKEPIDLGAPLGKPNYFMIVKSPLDGHNPNPLQRIKGPTLGLDFSIAPLAELPPSAPPPPQWTRGRLPEKRDNYQDMRWEKKAFLVKDHIGYCHTISNYPPDASWNSNGQPHASKNPPVGDPEDEEVEPEFAKQYLDADCECCKWKTDDGENCQPYFVSRPPHSPQNYYRCEVPTCMDRANCWVDSNQYGNANHRQPTSDDFIDCDSIWDKCHPEEKKVETKRGSFMEFLDSKDWMVRTEIDAGLRIGTYGDNDTFPLLAVQGSIVFGSGEESSLTLSTVEPWVVYESPMFTIVLPAIEGKLRFGTTPGVDPKEGGLNEYLWLQITGFGPTVNIWNRAHLVEIKDWRVSVTLRANYTRTPNLFVEWGEADISFEATALLWFGMEVKMRGTIFSKTSASFEVEHEGGWRPNVDLGDMLNQFTTPRMRGYLSFGDFNEIQNAAGADGETGIARCTGGDEARIAGRENQTCGAMSFGIEASLPKPMEIKGRDNTTLVRLRGYDMATTEGDDGGTGVEDAANTTGPRFMSNVIVPFPTALFGLDNMSFRIDGALEFPNLLGTPVLGGACTFKLLGQGNTGCTFSAPGWTAFNTSNFVMIFPGITVRATIGQGKFHGLLKTQTPASFGMPGVFMMDRVMAWGSVIVPTKLSTLMSERTTDFGFHGRFRFGGTDDPNSGLIATFGARIEKANAFDRQLTVKFRHRGGWSLFDTENKWLQDIFTTQWFEGRLEVGKRVKMVANVTWQNGLDLTPGGFLHLMEGSTVGLALDYKAPLRCCSYIIIEPVEEGAPAKYCSGTFALQESMEVPSGRPVYRHQTMKSFIYWSDKGVNQFRTSAGWRCQYYSSSNPDLDGTEAKESGKPERVTAWTLERYPLGLSFVARDCPVEDDDDEFTPEQSLSSVKATRVGSPKNVWTYTGLDLPSRSAGGTGLSNMTTQRHRGIKLRCARNDNTYAGDRVQPSPPPALISEREEAPIEAKMEMSIDAALRIGQLGQLSLRGVLKRSGRSRLTLKPMESGWTPLAQQLPEAKVEASMFTGEIMLKESTMTFGECINAIASSGRSVVGEDYNPDECMFGRLSMRIMAGPTPEACLIFRLLDDGSWSDTDCFLKSRGMTFQLSFGDGFEEEEAGASDSLTSQFMQGDGMRLQVQGKNTVYFGGRDEDEPGLDFDVTTVINPRALSLMLQIDHPGGWRPYPRALPFLKTPRLSGTFVMNTTGRYISLEAGWPGPINLLDGIIAITKPKDAAAGTRGPVIRLDVYIPYFAVNAVKDSLAEDKEYEAAMAAIPVERRESYPTRPPSPPASPPFDGYGERSYRPIEMGISFLGDICITASKQEGQRCMSTALGNTEDPFVIWTKGRMTDGDIRPLAPLSFILPDAMVNAVVIKGTEDYPLKWDMVIDFSAYGDSEKDLLKFDCSGYLVLNLKFMFIPEFVLKMVGVGKVSGTAGIEGAFLVELAVIEGGTLPGLDDDMPGVAVSISNVEEAYLPVFNRQRFVSKGLGLYAQIEAPRWARGLCHTTIFLNITIVSPLQSIWSAECPVDIRWFDIPDPNEGNVVERFKARILYALYEGVTPIRSVEYLRLSGIRLSSEIDIGNRAFTGAFESFFHLATSAPNDAPLHVRDQLRDPCADISNSLCMRAKMVTSVGIQSDETFLIWNLKLNLGASMSGAWVGPLGFDDFAVLDSAIEFGAKVEVVINPGTGVVAYPMISRVAWSTLLYWRRDPDVPWPTALYTRGNCVAVGLSEVSCDAWPPDLSPAAIAAREGVDLMDVAPNNVVKVETKFLLELAPHDHKALSALKLPKFGFRVAINDIYPDDIARVLLSLARGMVNNFIMRRPSLLALQRRALPQLMAAADSLMAFRLSPLIDRETFDVLMSLEFELSVVSEMGLRPGFHVFGSVTTTLFGVSCFVSAELYWHPGEFDEKMLTDWMGGGMLTKLINGGIGLALEFTNIPYVPVLKCVGLVNKTYFAVEATTKMYSPPFLANLASGAADMVGADASTAATVGSAFIYSLDVRYAIEGSKDGDKYALKVAFYTQISLPLLGQLRARGVYDVDSKALATGSPWNDFEIEAAVSTRIFGFCMAGSVSYINSVGWWSAMLTIDLAEYGKFMLGGQITDWTASSYQAQLAGELVISPELNTMLTSLVVKGIAWGIVYASFSATGIPIGAGILTNGPVPDAITSFLTTVFSLSRLMMDADANKFMLDIEVQYAINGVESDFKFGIPQDFSVFGRRMSSAAGAVGLGRRHRQLHEEFVANASAAWELENADINERMEMTPEQQFARGLGKEDDEHHSWTTTARQWHDHHHRRLSEMDLCGYCDSAVGQGTRVCSEEGDPAAAGVDGTAQMGAPQGRRLTAEEERQHIREGRRLSARGYGKLTPAYLLEAMQKTMTYEYIQGKIGDIDHTIAGDISFPPLNFKLMMDTRVQILASGITVTFAGEFSLMGVRVAGNGELSTVGGLRYMNYVGTGVVGNLGLPFLPELSGTITAKYENGVASLSMATSVTLFGYQLSGSASFSTSGFIATFQVEAAMVDTSFTLFFQSTIYNVIRYVAGNKAADQLRTIIETIVVTSLGLRYGGDSNMYYRLGFTLNGVPKMLEFLDRNKGVLIKLFDLLSVVGGIGKQVLTALAPLDITIDLPTMQADAICTPAMPCICDTEIYCPLDRRRSRALTSATPSPGEMSGAVRAARALAGAAEGDAVRVHTPRLHAHNASSITVSYLDANGQTATTEDGEGSEAEWEEDVPDFDEMSREELGDMMANELQAQLNEELSAMPNIKAGSVKIIKMVGRPGKLVPYMPLAQAAATAITKAATGPHNHSMPLPKSRVILPPFTKKEELGMRRRLSNCVGKYTGVPVLSRYRLLLTGCCGYQTCADARFSLSGSVRLQITSQIAALEGSLRVQLIGPGMGLASIDETWGGRFEIAYAKANNICDLVPKLSTYCIGNIGGGSTKFELSWLGFDYELTVNFDWATVCLTDILPCGMIPL